LNFVDTTPPITPPHLDFDLDRDLDLDWSKSKSKSKSTWWKWLELALRPLTPKVCERSELSPPMDMTLKPWLHEERELVADMRIFQVHRLRAQSPRTGQYCSISLLEAGDWVNVVALTPEEDVVLVRQFRHGTGAFTLEIPGGMIDKGETPAQAAIRELREESGYVGDGPVLLGVVTPNPAFLNNHCHTYLLQNCRRVGELQLDRGEDLEVLTRPLHEIPRIIASGAIDHALVICAFWWLTQRLQTKSSHEEHE